MAEFEHNRLYIREAVAQLLEAYSHIDNTGGNCRIDFVSHDCCYHCNFIGDVIKLLKDYE